MLTGGGDMNEIMSDYELISLTLDHIRRIAGVIELVRIE